jgi:hypothetical protein
MNDLADGRGVQFGRRDAGASLGIELAAKSGKHRIFQPGDIIAKLSLPRGDCDLPTLAH